MTFKLSHSRTHTYERCPQMYEYKYVQGLRVEDGLFNLFFGSAVHEAIEASVLAHFNFEPASDEEISKVFVDSFQASIKDKTVTYPKGFDESVAIEVGTGLASEFNRDWPTYGLTPLVTDDGKPVMERYLKTKIAPGLLLDGVPDLIALNEKGEVVVIDFKTAKTLSSPEFLMLAEQLTAYQILIEAHAKELGIEKVDQLGYLELKKNKTDRAQRVFPPTLVPARDRHAKEAYIQKLRYVKSDIKQGRFPRRPMMAFNSPCSMCDYRQLCTNGSTQNLSVA